MLRIKSQVNKIFSKDLLNKFSTKNFASQKGLKGINICDNPYTLEVKNILILLLIKLIKKETF
jgi:hypothetical protein